MKNEIKNSIAIVVFLLFVATPVSADEMAFRFKNPSFSGIGTSSHYLTVENH